MWTGDAGRDVTGARQGTTPVAAALLRPQGCEGGQRAPGPAGRGGVRRGEEAGEGQGGVTRRQRAPVRRTAAGRCRDAEFDSDGVCDVSRDR